MVYIYKIHSVLWRLILHVFIVHVFIVHVVNTLGVIRLLPQVIERWAPISSYFLWWILLLQKIGVYIPHGVI